MKIAIALFLLTASMAAQTSRIPKDACLIIDGVCAKPCIDRSGECVQPPKCKKGEYLSFDGECLHDQTGETHLSEDGHHVSTCLNNSCSHALADSYGWGGAFVTTRSIESGEWKYLADTGDEFLYAYPLPTDKQIICHSDDDYGKISKCDVPKGMSAEDAVKLVAQQTLDAGRQSAGELDACHASNQELRRSYLQLLRSMIAKPAKRKTHSGNTSSKETK